MTNGEALDCDQALAWPDQVSNQQLSASLLSELQDLTYVARQRSEYLNAFWVG